VGRCFACVWAALLLLFPLIQLLAPGKHAPLITSSLFCLWVYLGNSILVLGMREEGWVGGMLLTELAYG
jgi:hypothetical protein